MSLPAPAAKDPTPGTVSAPDCVIAPAAVTVRLPDTELAPRSIALVSLIVALVALTTDTVEKLFALSSVIALAPAVSVVPLVTVSAPLSVIAPAAVTASVPLTVEAPRSIAFVSFSWTFRPVTIETVPKLFAPASVMSLPAPAAKDPTPGTVSAPDCVIAPAAVTVRLPDTELAPRSIAFVSLIVALVALTTDTVAKLFALSTVIALAPAATCVTAATARSQERLVGREARS